jgi:aromatic ring hydroxylase
MPTASRSIPGGRWRIWTAGSDLCEKLPSPSHRFATGPSLSGKRARGWFFFPSYAEFTGPVAADVQSFAQAANADAPTRVKLAYDTAVSSFSGRQQLYERYYSGDPVRLAGAWYAMYDKGPHITRIHTMLDEIERKYS